MKASGTQQKAPIRDTKLEKSLAAATARTAVEIQMNPRNELVTHTWHQLEPAILAASAALGTVPGTVPGTDTGTAGGAFAAPVRSPSLNPSSGAPGKQGKQGQP